MAKILVRGDAVYECDVCKRRVRVPTQRRGIDVVQRCIVTNNCQGKLHRIRLTKEINETPAFPPEVTGLQDWAQRKILYNHEQQVQSAKWTINHNLANNPNVYAYVVDDITEQSTLTKPKQVNVIDLNTIELIFDEAKRGVAQCIASSSKNFANPNATAGVAVAEEDMLITHAGELTIATLDTSANTTLTMVYDSPSSTQPVSLEYTGISSPSISSAWNDADFVILNGRRYRVRSFNILTSDPAPTYFGQGAIASGSLVTITSALKANDTIILLAHTPFATADKVSQKYIDCVNLANIAYLYYNAGNLYAKPAAIKNTYPPIIVA